MLTSPTISGIESLLSSRKKEKVFSQKSMTLFSVLTSEKEIIEKTMNISACILLFLWLWR